MKKIFVLTGILMFVFACLANAKYDDLILRRIITDVDLNENTGVIVVNYIVIQKAPGDSVQTYSSGSAIHNYRLNNKDITDNELAEIARKEFTIYKSDYIFGKRVDAYKDMTAYDYTEQELEEVIQSAIQEVEAMFEAGPESVIRDSGKPYWKYIIGFFFVVFAFMAIRAALWNRRK